MATYPHEQPLGFEATGTGGTVTVVLRGDLDVGTEGSLGQHLARITQNEPGRLIFDMAQVGFVDCASARLIVGTDRSLPEGVRPVIRGPRPVVRRLLQITGLDARCDLAD